MTNVGTSPIAADDVLADVDPRATPPIPANPGCHDTHLGRQGRRQPGRPPRTRTRGDLALRLPGHHHRADDQRRRRRRHRRLDHSTGTCPVVDFDAAFVDAFHPGIEVDKTADPTALLGGGEVTYTYRVRNTGDVPLSNVADRITDDTCSPVTYVTGDNDGDGLLDTPNSIFEDHLDETWIFTCTTRIDQTTTNT